MNKLIIIITATLFVLISCTPAEDLNKINTSSSILGTWDLKGITVGSTPKDLSPCEEKFSQFQFLDNLKAIEDEGYTNGGTTCSHYTYNNKYALTDNILTITENKTSYINESKYYIIESTSNKLKIKLFYSKEDVKGKIYADTFPVAEQITFSYERVN